MAILTPRDNFHLYAQAVIKEKMVSSVYRLPVLIRALAGINGADELMPDDLTVVGKKLSFGERTKHRGTQYVWKWQATDTDDSAVVGYKGTGATATDYTHENIKSAQISMFELETPIRVDNDVLEAAEEKAMNFATGGKVKAAGGVIGSVISDAHAMKMSTHLLNLAGRIYTGAPASYTTAKASNLIGMNAWLSDANDIATVDRSQAANAKFRAQYTSTAQQVSLSWVDAIKSRGVTKTVGTTEPLRKWGSKADLALMDKDIYEKLHAEYVARFAHNTNGKFDQHQDTWLGKLDNYFVYDGTTFVLDYGCAANAFYMLDTSTWMFKSMKLMSVAPFVSPRDLLPGTGQNNSTNSAIVTKCQLLCENPYLNFRASNCS